MERIGRTQRTPLSSQRMDLGQETAASACGKQVGEQRRAVGRPFSRVTANQTGPLGVSRCSQSSNVRPVDLRKPWIAFSGASTRGPLRSTVMSGCTAGRPGTIRARRRGVAKVCVLLVGETGSLSREQTCFSSSCAPPGCMRAGISSESTSSRRSGMACAHKRAVHELRNTLA